MNARNMTEFIYGISDAKEVKDLQAELATQIATKMYAYLLAYADDGVIWGYVDDGILKISTTDFPNISPQLRLETLWEVRLFGEKSEWHLWRASNTWMACTVFEGEGTKAKSFDEQYILWGTSEAEVPQGGFYPVHETDLGIVHAPPIKMKDRHTLILSVRHYIDHDEAGAAYIKISRLMNLSNRGEK